MAIKMNIPHDAGSAPKDLITKNIYHVIINRITVYDRKINFSRKQTENRYKPGDMNNLAV